MFKNEYLLFIILIPILLASVSEWNEFLSSRASTFFDWHQNKLTRFPPFPPAGPSPSHCDDILIVTHHDLLTDLKTQLYRLSSFLHVQLTTQHLHCILHNSQGHFKRKKNRSTLLKETEVFSDFTNKTLQDQEFQLKNFIWRKFKQKISLWMFEKR